MNLQQKNYTVYNLFYNRSIQEIFIEFFQNFIPLNTVSQHEQEQYRLSTTLE